MRFTFLALKGEAMNFCYAQDTLSLSITLVRKTLKITIAADEKEKPRKGLSRS